MRAPGFLALARVLAWAAGYSAALVVAYAYATLPDELPLSRWTTTSKTMFFALRVPVINIAIVGLCDLLARSLSRVPAAHRPAAERAAAALLCTAGLEAWLSSIQIVSPAEPSFARAVAPFAVSVVGLGLAAYNARWLLAEHGLRALRPTRLEQLLGAALLASILLLNLPLLAPGLLR